MTRSQEIAGNVRAEMARLNYKQSQLAALLGVSQAAASRRMSGQIVLDVEELFSIAEWLDVPVTALIESSTRRSSGSPSTAGYPADSVPVWTVPADLARAA